MKTVLKLSLMTSLFALVCGVVFGQELNNPNKLPACPNAEYYRATNLKYWNNCWGEYLLLHGENSNPYETKNFKMLVKLNPFVEIIESEWANGLPNGWGKLRYRGGDKYFGQIKDALPDGQGEYRFLNGDIYRGEFAKGKFHGEGNLTKKNGIQFSGNWRNDNFIREVKINPPNPNTSIATNTDRSEID